MKKENKFLDSIKSVLGKQIGKVIALLILILVLILGYKFIFNNDKQEIDTSYLVAKLEAASELTTSKLTYTGFSKFKDEGTIFIDRSDFKMIYTATARAGIDVKEIKIEKNNKEIVVTLPKAKILDVKVELSDIEYFDEGFAIFNTDEKENANSAIKLAEEKAKEELSNMGILEMADAQAEILVRGLLQESITNEYTLKFNVK